jgi:hypothetical protein
MLKPTGIKNPPPPAASPPLHSLLGPIKGAVSTPLHPPHRFPPSFFILHDSNTIPVELQPPPPLLPVVSLASPSSRLWSPRWGSPLDPLHVEVTPSSPRGRSCPGVWALTSSLAGVSRSPRWTVVLMWFTVFIDPTHGFSYWKNPKFSNSESLHRGPSALYKFKSCPWFRILFKK